MSQSNSYVIPAAASAVVATGLAVMGQPMQTVALAAAAVFPAVYLLGQQGGVQIKQSTKSGPDYLDELEAAESKKKQKKKQKAEEARRKEQEKAEKAAQEAAQQRAAASAAKTQSSKASVAAAAADSTEDEDDDKKPLTKTQIKKAKKEAARKAEEDRLKAEAEAKRKAEESDKKKKKKKAKKATTAESVNTDDADADELLLAAQAKADNEAGWSVQKSDKPSSLKQTKPKVKDSKEKSGPTIPVPTLEQYAEMFIPFKNHAQLIGAQGATLRTLCEATGARIDMPKKDSGSTKVQITGSAEAVKKAEGAINSLITKGYSSFTHPGWVHDDITVDEKHMGAVIGKGGEYIKTIQSKTNTRINMPDKDQVGGKVVIVGKKEDVRAARLAIKELMAEGYSPLTHEGFIKKEIQFPSDKLHLLIGAKGQTIKSIQGNTKTKINIPERTSRTSGTAPLNVTVVGEPAGVTQAEKEILRLLIPPQIIQEDPEEEYVNGTWSESGPTEDELWD